MKVLLTGGRGMVGRNLLEHPKADSFDVLAPTSEQLDLTAFDDVLRVVSDYAPDIVIHAAGRVGGIQANMREPVSFLVDNLDMGRNVVLASQKSGVSRLLNLGSSCMYPRDAENPLREDMILTGQLEPTNEGYALAKIVTARLCDYVSSQSDDFDYKTLVPCNIFGRFDKFDPRHSHMVPALIHKIHAAKERGMEDVEIWGSGEARREFMYAGDLADAIWRAVDEFESLPSIMNLGVGHDHTINEYYDAVADAVGYEGRFFHNLEKPVGMLRKLVDTHKATEWGWSPRFELGQALEHTYRFYLEEFL